jgi:hypothetical protein
MSPLQQFLNQFYLYCFRFLPINVQDMNKLAAVNRFHLTQSKKSGSEMWCPRRPLGVPVLQRRPQWPCSLPVGKKGELHNGGSTLTGTT